MCEGGISDVLLFVLSAVNSQVYRSCAAIPALQGQHMNTLKKCLFPVSMNFPKTGVRVGPLALSAQLRLDSQQLVAKLGVCLLNHSYSHSLQQISHPQKYNLMAS